MVKRTNPFAQYAHPESTLAKRVKYVENQVRNNRAEMKFRTWVMPTGALPTGSVEVRDLTAISQGNSVDTREGNHIKVWRVEVRGDISAGLSCYLLQARDGSAPVFADFSSTNAGSFLTTAANNTSLVEWNYHRPVPGITGVPVPLRFSRKFKGLKVSYPSTTSTPNTNGLYVVILNNSGSTLSNNLSMRIWFTE